MQWFKLTVDGMAEVEELERGLQFLLGHFLLFQIQHWLSRSIFAFLNPTQSLFLLTFLQTLKFHIEDVEVDPLTFSLNCPEPTR